MKKKKPVKGRLACPQNSFWLPDTLMNRLVVRRWHFLLIVMSIATILLFVPVNKANQMQPEDVSLVEIQEQHAPPTKPESKPEPAKPARPPEPPKPEQAPADPDELPPQPTSVPPPEPQFGLPDKAMSEAGDMAVSTGNSLMTPAVDSIVKSAPPPVTADSIVKPAPAPVTASPGYLQDVKNKYLADLVRLLERRKPHPRGLRNQEMECIVRIRFLIEKDGHIMNVSISGPSPYVILNESARKTVEKLAVYKPIPQCLGLSQLELEVPFLFTLD